MNTYIITYRKDYSEHSLISRAIALEFDTAEQARIWVHDHEKDYGVMPTIRLEKSKNSCAWCA